MKLKYANTHAIQRMAKGMSLKSERKNPCFKPSFYIWSMFRVLGIYNFESNP